jgi:hypothetical protein
MRLALTLDSKVVQSAERFRGKHEHFPNTQQLRFGCWRGRDFRRRCPEKIFPLRGYVESVALRPS